MNFFSLTDLQMQTEFGYHWLSLLHAHSRWALGSCPRTPTFCIFVVPRESWGPAQVSYGSINDMLIEAPVLGLKPAKGLTKDPLPRILQGGQSNCGLLEVSDALGAIDIQNMPSKSPVRKAQWIQLPLL